MKAVLQFSGTLGGTYANIATVLLKNGQAYEVKPFLEADLNGNQLQTGFEVTISARAFALHSTVLSQSAWFFRLYFPELDTNIALGYRAYMMQFNGLLSRNSKAAHDMQIRFVIGPDEYAEFSLEADNATNPTPETTEITVIYG